jgi:hypothetical protein
MALQLIQNQGSSLTQYISLVIKEHEQASNFLKKLNNTKIQAESAGNIDTEEQVADLFIPSMETSNMSNYAIMFNISWTEESMMNAYSFMKLRLAI